MGIVMCLIIGGPAIYIIIGIGISLLFHVIYFACVWHRIPMAEATLKIATKVVHRYSCVMWISLGFSLLSVVFIVMWFFGTYGMYRMAGFDFTMTETMANRAHENKDLARERGESGNYAYLIWVVSMLVMFWGSITIGYIVHAICAGVMGTWYFGTSRKRTITDAVVRALTVNLGSISFAAFLVAAIKTLEAICGDMKDKAIANRNAGAAILACMMQCILQWLGEMLNYFNTLAIVRVAVYGESFCTAAKRTMNMMKYRGMDQIINDDLSSLPIWLGCQIIFLLAIPCLFAWFKFITPDYVIVGVITSTKENETFETALWSVIFSICALLIPLSILNVIPSFVQSLYVLWGDDPAAFDEVHPQESHELKAAAWECLGYKVVYDDHRIQGRGGQRYA